MRMSTIGQEQACLTLFDSILSHLRRQERQAHRKEQLSPLVLALAGEHFCADPNFQSWLMKLYAECTLFHLLLAGHCIMRSCRNCYKKAIGQ